MIPSSIFQLKELKYLLMQKNCLKEVDDRIGNLSTLEELVRKHLNLFFSKPISFIFLYFCMNSVVSALFSQDLSHNQLVKLPHAIGFLSHVFKFTMNHNKLETLPSEIGGMLGMIETFKVKRCSLQ